MGNLLTIRIYNEQTGDYKPLRTEWIDDKDMPNLLRYMQTQPQIHGFYKYSLTTTGNKQTHVLYNICADPVEYSRYLKYRVHNVGESTNTENIIEQ